MIAAALALLLQASSSSASATSEAEDWACATPLIEKNFMQPVKADELARRIADECTRPYIAASSQPVIEGNERLLYSYKVQIFTLDIEARIAQARRKDAIVLKR